MARAVLAVFGIVILAALGVFLFDAALYNAGDESTVTNETWIVDVGNWVSVNESDTLRATFDNSVTVYNNTSAQMDSGVDYEWARGNASVKALSGGDLQQGNESSITYRYSKATQEQYRIASLLSNVPSVVGVALPLGIAILFFMVLRG